MPRLRMTPGQQAIFDELVDFAQGARMINVPQLAQFWGRDVRCVRDWVQENGLPRFRLGNGYSYQIRDVAKAMERAQEDAPLAV